MAIIKPSALVQSLSGRIGGATFAQTKYGITLRTNPQKTKKETARAQRQRNRYRQQVNRWNRLSEDDRAAWRISAANLAFPNRLGIHRPISGFNLFMKVFMQGDALFFPPGAPQVFSGTTAPPNVLAFTCVSGGAKQITFSTLTGSPSPWAVVAASRPITQSPVNRFRIWKTLGVFPIVTSPLTITTVWNAAVGDPQPGETVAVKFRLWDFDAARLPSTDTQAVTTAS